MKLVGLTGGIGSGKTTISKAFETLGVPVYNSDIRSKWLTMNDTRIIYGMQQIIGADAYINGDYNKNLVASVIFSDKQKLTEVNQLIHPIVCEDFDNWVSIQARQGVPYIINESAIMIECGLAERFDAVILVTAPQEMRIQRTMSRDKMLRKHVEERIGNQMNDADKMKYATDIIVTDDAHFIMPQILEIHNRLKIA